MLSCLYLLFIVLIVLSPMSILFNYVITLFKTIVWFLCEMSLERYYICVCFHSCLWFLYCHPTFDNYS